MLDLNLARAANRSFYARLGRQLGRLGSGSIWQMFEHLLFEAWGQGGGQDGPALTGLKVHGREGWQEECSR